MTWLVALTLAATAPMADVWPFAAKRLPDGSVEYAYDLTLIKAGNGSPDARAAHDVAEVRGFLRTLPKTVTVRVSEWTVVTLSAARGLEPTPLAASFARVSPGPMVSDNPIAPEPGAKLRPALHPETPKVLVGAEMMVWLVRTLEESALAAVEVDTEWLRRELWTSVAERAVAKFKSSDGDVREGALALATRVIAANACLDRARLPAWVRNDADINLAVEAEIARHTAEAEGLVAPAPWVWNTELACGWVRGRLLAQPFEASRAGTAAVLLFLQMLEKDSKAKAYFDRIRVRRDRFVGTPTIDRLPGWASGGVSKSLDDLAGFFEGLPVTERTPPALVAAPVTPFGRFVAELAGPERSALVDEFAAAAQDGRLAPTSSSWPLAREATLVPVANADAHKGLQVDSSWRDRLVGSFAALQGLHHEGRGAGEVPSPDAPERSKLSVRLQVPPFVEAEPLAEVYERAGQSLDKLVEALTVDNLGGLKGFMPDGKRTSFTLVDAAKHLAPLLHALAVLAVAEQKPVDAKALAEARRFVATWRTAPGLTADVRAAFASPVSQGSQRAHAAVLGVGRREFSATFGAKPKVEVFAETGTFEVNVDAEQRYIVPVLVTGSATAPAALPPLDRKLLREAIDRVGKDRFKGESAYVEALTLPGGVPVDPP